MGSRSASWCATRSLAGLLIAVLVAAGCGKGSNSSSSAPPATTPRAGASTSVAAPAGHSPYDDGPRAGETPIDESLVKKGEALFTAKGCTVCHGFGKKITCPDLNAVTMRRTASWMEHQILHPEIMVKDDPITRQLRTQYALPMTNQGLKTDEARAVIEFLKHKNKETAGAK
jgi:hypothetical protein